MLYLDYALKNLPVQTNIKNTQVACKTVVTDDKHQGHKLSSMLLLELP